jgi:glycosyltransferase involved in cell wall biosynthesis
VVYLGLFNSYQGIDLLLEAIVKVKSESKGVHFLLMGFPEEEYRKKAADWGIDDVITFTGRVDYNRTPLLLSAGDIAVSPKLARTEANGKLFNYLACGLPTVVFESAVNREILGDVGIYAEYGNPDLLAHSIVELLKDDDRMIKLGREARTRAVELHSWSGRAVQLNSVYRGLIARHHSLVL